MLKIRDIFGFSQSGLSTSLWSVRLGLLPTAILINWILPRYSAVRTFWTCKAGSIDWHRRLWGWTSSARTSWPIAETCLFLVLGRRVLPRMHPCWLWNFFVSCLNTAHFLLFTLAFHLFRQLSCVLRPICFRVCFENGGFIEGRVWGSFEILDWVLATSTETTAHSKSILGRILQPLRTSTSTSLSLFVARGNTFEGSCSHGFVFNLANSLFEIVKVIQCVYTTLRLFSILSLRTTP